MLCTKCSVSNHKFVVRIGGSSVRAWSAGTDVSKPVFSGAALIAKPPVQLGASRGVLSSSCCWTFTRAPSWRRFHCSCSSDLIAAMSKSPTGSSSGGRRGRGRGGGGGCSTSESSDGGERPLSPSASDLLEPAVQLMIHGEGYQPRPLRSWRRCPLIQASRQAEFRPVPEGSPAEIRLLPEHLRVSLNGCKLFQPQQIAEYNRMLRKDGKLVSGVDALATRARVKPGRLYHKFDSLCVLATSKAGRLLLLQHRILPHVFYALCYDPAHKLYIDLLNMYERRWFAISNTYGKEAEDSSWGAGTSCNRSHDVCN